MPLHSDPLSTAGSMNPLQHWSLSHWPFTAAAAGELPFAGTPQRQATADLNCWLGGRSQAALLVADSGCGTSTWLRWWAGSSGFGRQAIQAVVSQGPAASPRSAWSRLAIAWGLDPLADASPPRLDDTVQQIAGSGILPLWLIDRADPVTTDLAGDLITRNGSLRVVLAVTPARAAETATRLGRPARRFALPPLNLEDTADFLRQGLVAAGGRPDLFEPAAIARLHDRSDGRFKLLVELAQQALIEAARAGAQSITVAAVETAADERTRADEPVKAA
ncbi:MAG: hypothetical protein EA381_18935 [Planctomycetaceae bacterium]|nr:MAG: hypothetical protein EA381_18935 [Planctomycetaceae bacterium]